MNFKNDLKFFVLLFVGVADLIFITSLFIPIFDNNGDLKNWVTLLIEVSLFLPIAYYVANRFFIKEKKDNQEKEEKEEKERHEQKDRTTILILNKYKNFIINLKQVRRFQKWIESKSQMEPGDIVAPVKYNLEWNVNSTIRRAHTLIEFLEYNLPSYPEADSRIFEWKSVIEENAEKLERDMNNEHFLFEIEHAMGVIIGFLDKYEPMSTKYQDDLQKYLNFYREHTKFIVKVHGKQSKDIIHPDYTGY